MAHETVTVPAEQWTKIAEGMTALRVQSWSPQQVYLQRGQGAQAPDKPGSIVLHPSQIILNEDLGTLWPGVAGDAVWAFCGVAAELSVSHA